ncbi:nucleotide modification associated domain-containing protein [Brachyspira hyodysenteriae]|uniref:nucleotide modification associated domain-containing protein n=1 Tax=Brachyspira hyodysenteriae TaxID=159 RepID=UPI0022CDB4A2|nr:nucleotide modification associated domain-containing protein [Brachyspira hyodysenteriae]MCZ9840571.1 nucleotide modification associated domain-containing protein [Brachyspira hyodysenteriae]
MNKEDLIINECEELKNLLIAKNKDYGNSYDKTLNEFGIQIGLIRIEDKLNRLKNLLLLKEETMVEEKVLLIPYLI